MRIALVHSQYSSKNPSGENVVVELQADALHKAGHDVVLLTRNTDTEQKKPFYGFRAARNVIFGNGNSFEPELRAFRPDIVHVHNLFPNLGWKWLEKTETPVVTTLHNYRVFCAEGSGLLNGKPCDLCPRKGSIHAVLNRCYRDSAIKTVPLAIQNRREWIDHPLISLSTGLIFLSKTMESQFAVHGATDKATAVIPNFVAPNFHGHLEKNGKWIWIGRFTPEKGLVRLLENWPEGHRLDIFGDGPLWNQVKNKSSDLVVFKGRVGYDRIKRELPSYVGMVISSEMPGNSVGLVHLEAIAAGLPVVALTGSSSATEVLASGHGSVFKNGLELSSALRKWEEFPIPAKKIFQRFESEYSESTWLKKTMAFFEKVVGHNL